MKMKIYEIYTVDNPNASFFRGYRKHVAYVTAKRRDSAIKKFRKEHGTFDMGMDIAVRDEEQLRTKYLKLLDTIMEISSEMDSMDEKMKEI